MNILDYHLIGIGDFTHGSQNIYEYRFNLLKKALSETNKNIMIFIEDNEYHSKNIMKDKKLIFEKEGMYQNKYPYGVLCRYMNHYLESEIYFEIIKYIRKHKSRITIIGIDPDILERDMIMYETIVKHLDVDNINFLWAANAHVDDRSLDVANRKWIKKSHPKLTHFCGHYLKKKFRNKYCIILSQAYEGIVRFNGFCIGDDCEIRRSVINYFYKNFVYILNKKYMNDKPYKLYDKFHNKLIEFSNSYWTENNNGGYIIELKKPNWDYILFFNRISRLSPYKEY